MSMKKRYSGEFLSRDGHTYRCDIWQNTDDSFVVGDLTFGANALEISWESTSKEDCIIGSTATLTIESPGDRTYQDLYTIKVGEIRLNVYRDNELYWSGCLDPEFYEEPYSSAFRYDVSLTFSDFGILKRLKYDLTGQQKIYNIYQQAMNRARFTRGSTVTMVSTTMDGTRSVYGSSGLAVISDNFTDEDGDTATWYDALESSLKPLGLRVMQKGGHVYLYDLNGLFNSNNVAQIVWASDDQVMGVDKVANKVTVNFSPYGKKETSPKIVFTTKYDRTKVNLTDITPTSGVPPYYYSFKPNYSTDTSSEDVSFTIFTDTIGEGIQSKHNNARYFHIEPLFGGQESDGLAWMFTAGVGSLASGQPIRKLNQTIAAPNWNSQLMVADRFPLMPMSDEAASKYALRLSMNLLCDVRYNPFESYEESNEKDNYDYLLKHGEEVRIPVSVTLYDSSGNAVSHFSNQSVLDSYTTASMYSSMGKWIDGAHQNDCWLTYYEKQRKPNVSGVTGWKKNRQAVCRYPWPVASIVDSLDDGQYMPYPASGGWIEIVVYTGLKFIDYKILYEEESEYSATIRQKLRWLLYQAPQLEIVNRGLTWSEVDTDDLEYTGMLNEDAADKISLDTICGTSSSPYPNAQGIYIDSSSGQQVTTLQRAGRTNQVEQLLIGTYHSQFSERRTKLAGTCLHFTGFSTMIDEAQPGLKFIPLGITENLVNGEAECSFVELRPDEYDD